MTDELLLMEEILHQLIGIYPIIYGGLYIPGGAGFLPSTVGKYLTIFLGDSKNYMVERTCINLLCSKF